MSFARTKCGFWTLVSLGILLFGVIPMSAQLPTGTILGVVKDPSGGTIPEARITVTNSDTNESRTAATSGDGEFRVPGLNPGHYSLRVEKEGFKTSTQTSLTLTVAEELVLNPTMEVGSASQEVTVTGEAPLVNTTTSSLGGLVSEQQITDLPLNGRNYIDLSLMQSGVTQNANIGGGIYGTGVWFSSNGAPMRSNNFTLDGALMNTLNGGSAASVTGNTLGLDGIREYKVVTNNFSSEYGGTMGSQVVIVSKGGSNRWSGDVFEYIRNAAMDARNFFDYTYTVPNSGVKRLPAFQRNNFGGAFGGPIKKDKTFFFAVYEGLRQNTGVTTVDNVPPAACHSANNIVNSSCVTGLTGTINVPSVMQPLLALYPSPNLPGNQFTFDSSAHARDDYGQIRIDQNISASDSFFSRYTVDDAYINSPTAFSSVRTYNYGRDQFLTFSENHIFSPTLLNTARISYSRTSPSSNEQYPTPLDGPQYSLVGSGREMGTVGASGLTTLSIDGGNIILIQNVGSLSDDLFYTKGKHALKFGGLINHYTVGLNNPFEYTGRLTFQNLQGFLSGVPTQYNSATVASYPNYYYIYNTLGFYAQDDVRLTQRLTINAGLRYEFMNLPRETNGRGYDIPNILTDTTGTPGPLFVNSTKKNFAPRLGFAYDLFGKGKTSISGAYGIFYDVGNIGRIFVQNSFGTPPITNTVKITFPANQVVSLPIPTPASFFNLYTNDYNAKQPYTQQYNLTAAQQLPGGIGLQVSYVGMHGIHLWTTKDGNPVPPTYVSGQQFWPASDVSCENSVPSCRVNPGLTSVFYVDTIGTVWYNSLQINVAKRLSRGLEFNAAFTWSKALDTTQALGGNGDCSGIGSNSVRLSYYDEHYDKGPACADVPRNLRFNLLYHFPNMKSNGFLAKLVNGWWMGNIVSVQDGYAFTPTIAADRTRDANIGSNVARVSINRYTVAPGQVSPDGYTNTTTATFVPYNPQTVVTGNPQQWFNPYMFTLNPLGYLGNASRSMLRGPGLGQWNFSVDKDTALPMLGEKGSVEFRAELFNLLNRANFGMPNPTVFNGATTVTDLYGQAANGISAANPLGTAGQIIATATTSRQIQLSLRVLF